MDIKKRIQELSLDQKAKLYFMGLVRKGVIDTLPEDPKAAYIRDMMDKEDPKMDPEIRSDFDEPMFENDKLKKDKLKMAYAAYDKAEMNGDIRGQELALAVIDLLKSGELKEIATKLGYLKEMKVTDKDGNDVTSDIIKKLEKSLEKSGYKITKGYSSDADIRPGYKTRPMKEVDGMGANQKYYKLLNVLNDKGHLHRYGVIQLQTEFGLKEKEAQEIYNQYKKDLMKEVDGMEGGIDLNAISAKKASFVYTEQGGRFYSLTLSTSDGQTLKMKYDEANEWLKDTLSYIHEGDLLPRRYNSGLEDLDLIVARLEELGIEASHGDYMDVS